MKPEMPGTEIIWQSAVIGILLREQLTKQPGLEQANKLANMLFGPPKKLGRKSVYNCDSQILQ